LLKAPGAAPAPAQAPNAALAATDAGDEDLVDLQDSPQNL
jgi:hypothetical protein